MKKSARFIIGLGLLSVVALTQSGCGVREVVQTVQSVQRIRRQVQDQQQGRSEKEAALPGLEKAYRATLKPLQGGAGLVVCSPSGSDADFGAGCARWLQFYAGGQSELGQTPLWGAIDDARRDLKRTDLRLSGADALALAGKTGATHVATGTLAGNALRYELVRVADKKTVAIGSIKGDRQRLAAQLPALARQMCVALGVTSPRLPSQGESAPRLALLGALPMKARAKLPTVQAQQLAVMAKTSAPAALLHLQSLRVGPFDSHALRETPSAASRAAAARLIGLAPGNTQALGSSGWLAAQALVGNQALDRAVKQYPNNYLLQTAVMCRERVRPEIAGGNPAERAAAERAVRSASRNPVAWQELGWSIGQMAQSVRDGRYWNKMTSQEQATVSQLYPERLAANRAATQLDPGNAYGWWQMSEAAMFAGDETSADAGVWKAIALDPDDQRWYDHALNMYEPKWRGDRAQLQKAIGLIQARPQLFSALYVDCIGALKRSNMRPQADALLQKAIVDFTSQAAANPRDTRTRAALGHIYWSEKQHDKSLAVYAEVLKIDPRHAMAHYRSGWILHYMQRNYGPAETHYRAAIAASPELAEAINALGDITYYVRGDAKKAEALYRRAIALEDDGLFNAELARLLLDTGREAEARGQAQKAIANGYTDSASPIWSRLNIDPN